MNIACLIVAAGSSSRMESELPKQYQLLNGKPMLTHSIETFLKHQKITSVHVVYNPDNQDLYDQATQHLELPAPIKGGKTRQESVNNGLLAIESINPDYVLIHDAARPLITLKVIDRVISALNNHQAVIPTLPVEDTIKRINQTGQIIHTVDRNDLMRAQTPQGFDYNLIRNSHSILKNQKVTDDSSIIELLNTPVHTVRGSHINFKITTAQDMDRAQQLTQQHTSYRTGMGFDVHAFCEPKSTSHNCIKLCGIDIPHPKSLAGHSDADVGLHAIVDAILGALCLGDIGDHFPPSDDKHKDQDSAEFLLYTKRLADEHHAKISHIDVTLICQKPAISPHKDAMRARIADILQLNKNCVSVKATTTEKLGFTGRQEGIAAQCVCTLSVV